MEINEVLRNRLREERLKLGLSQEELGIKIGVKKQTIGKYEQGIARPPIESLDKLADIFDCSIDYLAGRTTNRDSSIFKGIVDGERYLFEVDRHEVDKPDTEEKFNRLVRKLKLVGFDVDRLMEDQADIDLDND